MIIDNVINQITLSLLCSFAGEVMLVMLSFRKSLTYCDQKWTAQSDHIMLITLIQCKPKIVDF